MNTPEGAFSDPLAPEQVAAFKKLRLIIFTVCVLVFAALLAQSVMPGGEIHEMLHAGAMATHMDSTGRASALAICVLAGLVFGWIASGRVAKVLARRIRT